MFKVGNSRQNHPGRRILKRPTLCGVWHTTRQAVSTTVVLGPLDISMLTKPFNTTRLRSRRLGITALSIYVPVIRIRWWLSSPISVSRLHRCDLLGNYPGYGRPLQLPRA